MKYTLSLNNNEFEIDGITFRAEDTSYGETGSQITIYIDGGHAQSDVDGEWVEMDGDYEVATFDVPYLDTYDDEFEIELTDEQTAKAKAYREAYPEDISESAEEEDIQRRAQQVADEYVQSKVDDHGNCDIVEGSRFEVYVGGAFWTFSFRNSGRGYWDAKFEHEGKS